MTVGELRQLISAGIADSAQVVVPGHDHTYHLATAEIGKAVQEDRRRLGEYFGDDCVEPEMKVLDVLIVG